jgi:hypothetical protein
MLSQPTNQPMNFLSWALEFALWTTKRNVQVDFWLVWCDQGPPAPACRKPKKTCEQPITPLVYEEVGGNYFILFPLRYVPKKASMIPPLVDKVSLIISSLFIFFSCIPCATDDFFHQQQSCLILSPQ